MNYIKGEPFNPGVSKHLFGISWQEWYPDLTSASHILRFQISNAFNLDWSFPLFFNRIIAAASSGSLKSVLRVFKYWLLSLNNKPSLVKDPMAAFAMESITEFFHPKVIIIVRHPAAVVWSMMRLNWGFSFQLLENKNHKIKKIANQYQSEIKSLNKVHFREKMLERSTIFWCIIYEYFYHLLQVHPEWILVKHEELSLNPEKEFQKLFNQLGFYYSVKVKEKIKDTTNCNNPKEADTGVVHHLNRNSAQNTETFRKHLSSTQIDYILNKTEKVRKMYGYK